MSDTIEESVDKKSKWGSPEKERPTLKWPHLYDVLRGKGMSKEKAARISNARRGRRGKGRLTTHAGRSAAKRRRQMKERSLRKIDDQLTTLVDKYDPDPAIVGLEYELTEVVTKAMTGMGHSVRAEVIRYGEEKGKIHLYVNDHEDHVFDDMSAVDKFFTNGMVMR